MPKGKVAKNNVARAEAQTQSNKTQENQSNKEPTLFGCTEESGTYSLTWGRAKTWLNVFYIGIILLSLYSAYIVRIKSVELYGYVIHEFDPWFNFRATEYLEEHGWYEFFHWFDRMSWYPIGRAVGSTIYPGMQITGVVIYRVLNAVGIHISLNNVCVLIPAWFGVIATAILGAIAYEISASLAATALATLTFSIIPAHTMRSMAGEFDNECISIAAMLLTFYFWTRSLRTPQSWPVGLLTGLAYGYMAAAWGGYIFVTNMIALHACVCVAVDWMWNRYSESLLKSYTLFFVVGTAIAMCVPVINTSPLKSLEQLSALLVFFGLYALHISEYFRRRAGYEIRSKKTLQLRIRVIFAILVSLLALATALSPRGYFGPLSARVRALFVAHTRTGNPLVDSVAEHQPSDPSAFWLYLHAVYIYWIFSTVFLPFLPVRNVPGVSFALLFSGASYYFSMRMARLLIFSGPAACLSTSIFVGPLLNWLLKQLFWNNECVTPDILEKVRALTARTDQDKDHGREEVHVLSERPLLPYSIMKAMSSTFIKRGSKLAFASLVVIALIITPSLVSTFRHSLVSSIHNAAPLILFRAQVQANGPPVIIDDYYASYLWLRNNTPEDARILAWWDYGYQITGIGNRTTLADGNTRDHEHIGTIGKLLSSPVNESYMLIRHLADYVYIWSGVRSDDLMKSAHMARIGNSVHRDICPNDPLCSHFGFINNDIKRPTQTMRKSLIYNLHGTGIVPGAYVSSSKFRLVYQSKYGLVRIFKVMNVSNESKAWVNNPENQVCDPPPHSWICRGQYPPAPEIQNLINKRWSFNKNKNVEDDEWLKQYHKEYMQKWN